MVFEWDNKMSLKNKLTKIICALFLLNCILIISCKPGKNKVAEVFSGNDFSNDDFSEELKTVLPAQENAKQLLPSLKHAMALCYGKNEYLPVWISENKECSLVDELIQDLDSLRFDGIIVRDTDIESIRNYKAKAIAETATLEDILRLDTFCSGLYIKASHDLLLGVVRSSIDSQWHHTNDSVWKIVAAIKSITDTKTYYSLDSFRSKWPVYRILKEARQHYTNLESDSALLKLKASISAASSDSIVSAIIQQEMPWLQFSADDSLKESVQLIKGYQYYFGQRMTGKLDSITLSFLQRPVKTTLNQIAVNQERLRWINQIPEHTNIVVPLGLMELFLTREGEEVVHMRTVIGKPGRSTPSLNANMVNVVINPPWGVPPTILKNDVAPGLSKSGGAYLAKKGLKAYDKKGKLVNVSKINGQNYKRFDYRQDPGERNALGAIKFNLPNKWDIYLHDTPHKEDFPNRNRAKSSGCIRLQRPLDLGFYILHEMEGNKKLTREKIDTIVTTHKTQYHKLQNKIPVHIVYLTAYQDSTGTRLRLLDDIYKRDAAVANKL